MSQKLLNIKWGFSYIAFKAIISKKYLLFIKLLTILFQSGTVWVNCWLVRCLDMPFGGVKESGSGREGGKQSTAFFTEEKTICIQY